MLQDVFSSVRFSSVKVDCQVYPSKYGLVSFDTLEIGEVVEPIRPLQFLEAISEAEKDKEKKIYEKNKQIEYKKMVECNLPDKKQQKVAGRDNSYGCKQKARL